MEYYNPNDNSTKQYAAIAVILFMALLAIAVSFISITVTPSSDTIVLIEIETAEEEEVEEEVKKVAPRPKPREKGKVSTVPAELPEDKRVGAVETPDKPKTVDKDLLVHNKEAENTESAQTKGEDEKSQTLNNNALFPQSESTSTDEVASGSHFDPLANEETKKGDGTGHNLTGADENDAGETTNKLGYARLDTELKNRGCDDLPLPATTYNESGEVVVKVTVKPDGSVKSAEAITLESTYNSVLWKLAEEAAMKARFKPSSDYSEGKITYIFSFH